MWFLFSLVIAAYYCLYKLVEYFPQLLWTPRPLGKGAHVRKIAHRGSRDEGLPENSIAAFRDACEAGAEVLELDVWMTRDGEAVVFHDEDFTRMTGGKCTGKVSEFKYSEFPELSPNDPAFSQAERCDLYSNKECKKIPLLRDVFRAVPKHIFFIIEFKHDSMELIAEVHSTIERENRKDTVFWFSLKEKINKKLRTFDSSIPTLTSVDSMLKLVVSYYCGVMPFMPVRDRIFGITLDAIPLERIAMNLPGLPSWVHLFLSFLLVGVPPRLLLIPALFAHYRRRGIPVWFLSVNSVKELDIAESQGATGVLTDRPHWLEKTMTVSNVKLQRVST